MSDLINRADAIEEISKGVWNVHELIDRIKALPSADAVSREDTVTLNSPITISAVQGEWRTDKGKSLMMCSVCGTLFNKHTDFFDFEEFANFCPYCGSRMKGGAE